MTRQLAETMDVKPVRITRTQGWIAYAVGAVLTIGPSALFDGYTPVLPPLLAALTAVAVVNLALVLRKR